MLQKRESEKRGTGTYDWLEAKYTFSFSQYFDKNQMGFRDLLVINEDKIAAGKGFAEHAHNDMEIITYIIEGAIEHKDSIGNIGRISAGEVQRMSAGSGIRHSEYNPDSDKKTHLLQIWIKPNKEGLNPDYEQISFAQRHEKENLVLLASDEANDGSMHINQDVKLYSGRLAIDEKILRELAPKRHAWIQMVKGSMTVNEVQLHAGDGLAISDEAKLEMKAINDSEFLYFDLN